MCYTCSLNLQNSKGYGLQISPSGFIVIYDHYSRTLSTWNVNGLHIATAIVAEDDEGLVSCMDVAHDGKHIVVGTIRTNTMTKNSNETGAITFRPMHTLRPIFNHKISSENIGPRCLKMTPGDHSVIVSYLSGSMQHLKEVR